MKTSLKFGLIILLYTVTSCSDLKLQKPYEFEPDVKTYATYENQTVWEWLQTQKSAAPATLLEPFKFDYLIEAIEYTGLQEEFNRKTDKRTFFLLNNGAFVGANKIFQALGGTATTAGLAAIRTRDKVRLTNLLKYHIINQYVTQIDPLYAFATNYFFQTLNDGDAGKILLRRTERWEIQLNPATVPPLAATRRAVNVRNHNLLYANGIAHSLNSDYARNVAF
jgi:Fasciclin domain